MSYQLPTLSEMHAFLNALTKMLDPDANVGSRYAPRWKINRATAAVATDVHANASAVRDDVMPDTAVGEMATRWGGIVGVDRKGATEARKSSALRVRGTVASAITTGDELVHAASGLRYQITETTTVPVAGYIDVDVAAIDTGAQTRLDAGEVLTFTATPAGLEASAELVLDLDEDGYDAEQDPPYRRRYLARTASRQSGGNQTDYVLWVEGLVAAGYCYPNRAGLGTVDVIGLHDGSGSARFLTPTERDDLLAALKAKIPSQLVGGALRVLTAVADPQPVEVTVDVSGDDAWAFDWDDASPPTVLAWTGASRLLQFSASRPASMKAGDRIVITGIANGHDGSQAKIEALSGADAVILEASPVGTPTAGNVVYAGGPIVDPVRDAILAHVNGDDLYAGDDAPIPASTASSTVNLRILARGIGPANPAGVYGTWVGGLLRSAIGAIASYPRAVRNATVVTPAADYEATDYAYPNDTQIGVITASAVVVRSA